MTNKKRKFELETNAIQSVLEALEHVQDAYQSEHRKTGITKAKLAEAIGRDPAYVSRILNGRVSNVTFLTLSRLLLALDRWPILASERLSDVVAPTNYHLADVLPDAYARAKTPSWKAVIRGTESDTSDKTSSRTQTRVTYENT